ncbi:Hsp20/alpha crystallin family protein [Thermoleptolyngbya sp. C42_A2020_037]|uniref:Hsp20/alpha crystallin family protein n=1 Tax=Thermoleptolyngbya sp. C42_A2020_037 TaxID=2747799 RepID=UPI0019F4FFAE|nr:Hsp20/alpha crystallin family protein [Thermoleptolyngbya sp. C42_A2020_037]MBF2084482.1 Hsp20/alpha crystallin family protein [Thermoleptolyngbya sp. C42_A2020_037]
MALVHWVPFRELETLQRDMNELLDVFNLEGDRKAGLRTTVPAIELQETPDALVLKAEIPGVDSKDLDIQVTAEAVAIKGERKSETHTEENGIKRSEFRYGSFSRVVPLPSRIQNDKVSAEYKDGILHLTLPKVEAEKNKVVKVTLG